MLRRRRTVAPPIPQSGHVLIMLHGHGSGASQLPAVLREQADDGWVRVTPNASIAVDGGLSWFDTGPRGVEPESLEASVESLRSVIASLVHDAGVDPGAIVLGGFSQGGAVAIATAIDRGARGEQPLGGLFVLAGFVPERVDHELDLRSVGARSVLIVHPDDDEVVPPFLMEALVDEIRSGRDVEEVRYETVVGGHAIGEEMLGVLTGWLASR